MSEVRLDMKVEVIDAPGKLWTIGGANKRTQQIIIYTADTAEACGEVEFESVTNVTPAGATS